MAKKILTIVLVAIAVAVLVALLWWWFLNRTPAPAQTIGTFGSGQDRTSTGAGGTGSGATNIGNPVAQTVGGGTGSELALGGTNYGSAPAGTPVSSAVSGVPGVTWVSPPRIVPGSLGLTEPGQIGGGSSGSGSGDTSGTVFNPTPTNGVLDSNPNGGVIPAYGGGYLSGGGGGNGLGLGGALLGAGAAGAVSCSSFLLGSITGAIGGIVAVQVNDAPKNTEDTLDCIARTIAKVTLQQITASTVNWINSGFKGSPAFVQDKNRFFTSVADEAAGRFIQGSALSFLCSPFQLQIKIAVAQTYAHREAPSCTLSQVVGNVNNFMNGTFSDGGWRGLISYTTMPTNNPYGAFLYSTVQLNTAVNSAVQTQQTDLLQGRGFLSFQQPTNCHIYEPSEEYPDGAYTETLPDGNIKVCDLETTTPGSVIAGSIDKTLGVSQDSLNMAKSFDEIISALISQLMNNVLYNGLSNVSGPSGYQGFYYTPDQQQAQTQAQVLLSQMQASTGIAQQYGGVEQGSISDVQNAQSQLQGLINCWTNAQKAAKDADDDAKASTAQQNASAAQAQFDGLQNLVDTYNNNITKANSAIALLESLQSRALSADSTDKVSAVANDYAAAKARGDILVQDDVTTAQQNRQTLQNQMAAQNQQTAAGLQQCNAF